MDLTALRNELTNDPLQLGYAARLAVADDRGVAELLNDRVGPGAAPIMLDAASKTEFMLGIAPALLALPSKTAAVQQKWDRVLGLLPAIGETVHLSDPTVAGLLAAAAADGVLTQAQIDALVTRLGSRAEVLFGSGVVVRPEDVGAAR